MQTLIISGGGNGIGRAVALLCGKDGGQVAILDRDQRAAESAAGEASEAGAHAAIGLACDVTEENGVREAFDAAYDKLGPPSGIFANAGIDIGGYVHELSIETWRSVVDTNLTGVFLVCKHGLQRMLAAGVKGSIVCTSSPAGSVALAAGGTGAYSATKAGISALVRCMAIDYARFGIRVNAVVPGATETGLMWSNVPAQQRDAIREQLRREIPLGRLADPIEPGRAVMWLLSDQSSYITGANLVCDGGVLAQGSISV